MQGTCHPGPGSEGRERASQCLLRPQGSSCLGYTCGSHSQLRVLITYYVRSLLLDAEAGGEQEVGCCQGLLVFQQNDKVEERFKKTYWKLATLLQTSLTVILLYHSLKSRLATNAQADKWMPVEWFPSSLTLFCSFSLSHACFSFSFNLLLQLGQSDTVCKDLLLPALLLTVPPTWPVCVDQHRGRGLGALRRHRPMVKHPSLQRDQMMRMPFHYRERDQHDIPETSQP
jgi:hypothetical protein